MVHLPIMVVASILGVWLFTLQHRFETARWTNREQWNFVSASLGGSSWLCPAARPALANRQYRFPPYPSSQSTSFRNYRLQLAHGNVRCAGWAGVDGLRAPWLTLWDEKSGRLGSLQRREHRHERGAK